MKVGIYSKWLNTLGGGEKVATVMAEALSEKKYKVDLISSFELEKGQIESKMGVDLSKVNLIAWYERRDNKLKPLTKKYDLFINVSYLDHLPSLAKKSIYYILFPTPIKRTFLGFIKYETLLPFLRKYLIIPEFSKGLNCLDEIYVRGGKWLMNKNIIVFSNPPKVFKATFRIYSEKMDMFSPKRVKFSSPNTKIKILDCYVDHHNSIISYNLQIFVNKAVNAVIKITTTGDMMKDALGLVSITVRNFRYLLWNLIKRYLPRYEMALYGSSSYKVAAGLETYDFFLSDSNFTKEWTQKYWAKDSKVLYPPVDVSEFSPAKRKEDIILNVGRFFVEGHSKRQDVLVRAFKEMIDEKKLSKGWELHLVGGIAGGWEHEEYVRKMKLEAKGYPIIFHHTASFKDLKDLYSKAKIYWHATGFSEGEKAKPIEHEHFGIVVVEAMAAGCVPVVYKGGGLKESVSDNCGFLWKNPSQLKKYSLELIKDKRKLRKMAKLSIKMSRKYSRERFSKELISIVERMTR